MHFHQALGHKVHKQRKLYAGQQSREIEREREREKDAGVHYKAGRAHKA